MRETIGGINHLRLRWQRTFLNRPADFYLTRLNELTLPEPFVGLAHDGQQSVACDVCGYSMARLEVTGGWIVEVCSATGLKPLLISTAFKDWLCDVTGKVSSVSVNDRSPATLPGSRS